MMTLLLFALYMFVCILIIGSFLDEENTSQWRAIIPTAICFIVGLWVIAASG